MNDDAKIAQLLYGKSSWTNVIVRAKAGIRYDFTLRERSGGFRDDIDILYQNIAYEPFASGFLRIHPESERSSVFGGPILIRIVGFVTFLFQHLGKKSDRQ